MSQITFAARECTTIKDWVIIRVINGKEGISTDEITKEAIKLVIFDTTFRDLVYDQVYQTLIAEQAPSTPAGLPETPG